MTTDDRLLITSIHQAVSELEFVQVQNYKLTATRHEDAEDSAAGDDDAEVQTSVAYRTTPSGADYRCQLTVNFNDGEITVDAAAVFRAAQPIQLADEVVSQFGQDVAMMALYPYLRQTVADLGARLGVQTELPLLRRGSFTFALSESSEPDHESHIP